MGQAHYPIEMGHCLNTKSKRKNFPSKIILTLVFTREEAGWVWLFFYNENFHLSLSPSLSLSLSLSLSFTETVIKWSALRLRYSIGSLYGRCLAWPAVVGSKKYCSVERRNKGAQWMIVSGLECLSNNNLLSCFTVVYQLSWTI